MAGHGSPPPPDRGEHPGRKVSNVISTQPRPLGQADKSHPLTNMVQRVRRERESASSLNGPSSRYNPDASPAVNRAAAEADVDVRRRRMRFGG